MTVTITTHSPAQTQALAERLAKLNAIAISQMEILIQDHRIEALEAHSGEPSPME